MTQTALPLETALAASSENATDFKKLLMDQVRAGGGTQAIDTKQLFQKLVKDTLDRGLPGTRAGRALRLCQTRSGGPRQWQLPQRRHTQNGARRFR